ncbi:MAG TPA: cobyric acid synthase [Bryobacteraceae bacterium]|nr:cobyric acid synthase [Bryobacteraceae bacterium]
MSARALMVLGTASHVGKSLLTAALGRIFADEGYRVAPFKAQNMSLNSAATPDGREIGRAQALQAEACRVPARAEMNPILLKPSSDTSSQVVVLGRVWGQSTAADYHQGRVEELFPIVVQSYHALAQEHDIIVIEGAGSPAEINLKVHDIVNMRMAQAARANCLLVGDIDRGGVFAALLGTLELLDSCERELIHAFVVNKFRGDVKLLEPGLEMISKRIGLPCAGVVHYLAETGLDEEDSVALEDRRGFTSLPAQGMLRIGVLAFPHLANFTDFDALRAEPSVALGFIDRPEDLASLDLLILPGSKQTLNDLAWLRKRGFERGILDFHGGAGIAGICGGMQMLGYSIDDPGGAESNGAPSCARGLGILPIDTVLEAEKTTRMVRGSAGLGEFHGYEIHLGETVYREGAREFARIRREGDDTSRRDGAIAATERAFGSYVHGLFQDDAFRHSFLAEARRACGLPPVTEWACVSAEREARIDRWANHVRRSLDMRLIHSLVGMT